MTPLLGLPFEWFTALVRGAELASLLFLVGPLSVLAVFLPPVAAEVNAANINLILAVTMVLGFRWPALWSLPLLTKPSLGVGLLWFVVRGEWRKLSVALGVTSALAICSFLVAPHLWMEYIAFLANGTPHTGDWPFPYPIWARMPIAIALVAWGAKTNRPWTVVAAAFIALPRLYFLSPAMLLGIIPLLRVDIRTTQVRASSAARVQLRVMRGLAHAVLRG